MELFSLSSISIDKNITAHSSVVNDIILLSDKRIATCSEDTTIKIFDLYNNYNCDVTLTGHTKGVRSIVELNKDTLVSASDDRSIIFWKFKNKELRSKFIIQYAHGGPITKVIKLRNNLLATSSNDYTIKIRKSIKPYEPLKKLEKHTDYVTSIVELDKKDYLISASFDRKVIVWDLKTYQIITIFDGIMCFYNNALSLIGNFIYIGGAESIYIISADNFTLKEVAKDKDTGMISSFMGLPDGNVLCGCSGAMKMFNVKKKKFVDTKKKICEGTITSITMINDEWFASSAFDNIIKVWKY